MRTRRRRNDVAKLIINEDVLDDSMPAEHAIRALALLARWATRKAQNQAGASEPIEANTVIDDVSKGYKARKVVN